MSVRDYLPARGVSITVPGFIVRDVWLMLSLAIASAVTGWAGGQLVAAGLLPVDGAGAVGVMVAWLGSAILLAAVVFAGGGRHLGVVAANADKTEADQ